MPDWKTAGNTAGWVKPNIIKSDFLSHPLHAVVSWRCSHVSFISINYLIGTQSDVHGL
jgi:hypothetical protein